MLENSQVSAYRNLHSLLPLLPPHQPRVTVLGEEQPGADGSGTPRGAFPLDGNAALPVLPHPREAGRTGMGLPRPACAHPGGIIGLPLSIFTQQTETLARQSLQKGYKTQCSSVECWMLVCTASLSISFIISQNKTLSYTFCNLMYSKAFPFCSFHFFDI